MKKKSIIIFVQDKLGGIFILIKNIVEALKHNFDIQVITIRSDRWHIPKASSYVYPVKFYSYSLSYFNKNTYNLDQLSKYIINDDSIILANDEFELQMYNYAKLKNPLVFILHGDYDLYYETAVKYSPLIDKFIAVSENIKIQLDKMIPTRNSDIIYLKHIVPDVPIRTHINLKQTHSLDIVFIGRLTEEKGFYDLVKIDNRLLAQGVIVNWKVIASGNKNEWLNSKNVTWIDIIDNKELLEQLLKCDLFILPSREEGFPVSLVEAMKAGLIPLVSKLPGAIDEIIVHGESGFKNSIGDIDAYVEQIIILHADKEKKKHMSLCSKINADRYFGHAETSHAYLQFFDSIMRLENNKNHLIVPSNSSFLEHSLFPNFATVLIRKSRFYTKRLLQFLTIH